MTTKICTRCKLAKDIVFFEEGSKRGPRAQCKSCRAAYARAYRKQNPDKVKAANKNSYWNNLDRERNDQLKVKFGITLVDYRRMLRNQNDVCLICKKPEVVKYKGKVKSLSVDHCHVTGKVRGLLCTKCNQALGLIADSPNIAFNMAIYLQSAN